MPDLFCEHYQRLILDPGAHFETPKDVLICKDLNPDQKRKILKAWQLDLTLLQVCDEENMSTDTEIKMLSRINQALILLANHPRSSSSGH